MIVITGAGGFIGSVMLGYLNRKGIRDIVIVDDLITKDAFKNLANKDFKKIYSTADCYDDLTDIQAVIHLGANSNTIDSNWNSFYEKNVLSTRKWHNFCKLNDIPFIFSSTAAIYGNNNFPLNYYAFSKQSSEFEITGVVLRLFNVYGPNEYHKGRMASVIYNWYQQLENLGKIKVFENSNTYKRDFIWVEDVCSTIYYFINNYKPGTYDLGTGKSFDFESVADCVLQNYGSQAKEHIPMPEDLSKQYQTNTCANTTNLINCGVDTSRFLSVEDGISEYFKYLKSKKHY